MIDIKQILQIVLYNSYADLKMEAARSYMGVFWWFVEPILYMSTFYIVFAKILKRGGDGFIFELIVGLIVWKWFATSVSVGSMSIYSNRKLIHKIYVPKVIFPLSTMITAFVKFLLVFGVFLVFARLANVVPEIYPFELMWLVLSELALIMSIALILSVIVPFVPDIKMIIDNGLIMMMFISGIFFKISSVNEVYQTYLYMNPMALIIEQFRVVLLEGGNLDADKLLIVNAITAGVLLFSIKLQSVFDKKLPKFIG